MRARNSFKLEIETEAKDFVLILYKISLLWRNISFLDQILTFVEANDVHKYLAPPPPSKSYFWSSNFQNLFWFWKFRKIHEA